MRIELIERLPVQGLNGVVDRGAGFDSLDEPACDLDDLSSAIKVGIRVEPPARGTVRGSGRRWLRRAGASSIRS